MENYHRQELFETELRMCMVSTVLAVAYGKAIVHESPTHCFSLLGSVKNYIF